MTERLSRSFAEWHGRTSQVKTWAGGPTYIPPLRRIWGWWFSMSWRPEMLSPLWNATRTVIGWPRIATSHKRLQCPQRPRQGPKMVPKCPNAQRCKHRFVKTTVHCPPREANELTIGCAFHWGTHKSLPRTVGAHQIAEVWGVSDSEPWPQMVGDESQILWFYGSDRPKNGYLLDRWSLYSAETLFQRCWVSNNFSLCPQPNMSCDLIATSACSPMPSTSVHKKCVARTRTASIGLKISPIRLVFVFFTILLPKQGPIQGFCWPMDGSYWVILVKPCKHKTRSETFNLLPICRFQV